MQQDMIVIIDLGSESNAKLARDIRALGVYSEIHNFDITKEELDKLSNVKGFILNGGPNNIVDGVKIDASEAVYNSNLPLLVINHEGKLSSIKEECTTEELSDFIFNKCRAEKNWTVENFINDQIELIRKQVGDKEVLLALSGGVDSSVVAALLIKAIGKKLHCVHVNHGLMRMGESEEVIEVFQNKLDANLIYVDATDRFLTKLENVEGITYLAQGTIYPDIVESGTKTMKNVKSHHNVGGLPEDLKFELVEPLKMLFKDEVRACGIALGLPETMVYRQPFPGPGLGVRCLGAITRDRLESLRISDAILREEFAKCGLSKKVWQYFTVVPDFKSVGVKNNARSFEWPVIIRAVNTIDAMTASIEEIDYVVLHRITQRIINEVPGVNRVLYDLTPKPCGTIEWE